MGPPLLGSESYIKDLDSGPDPTNDWIRKIRGVAEVEIGKKMESVGLEPGEAPEPVASYVPAVHLGNFIFRSGQLPGITGELKARGKTGRDLILEEGFGCGKVAAMNRLAALNSVVEGLDRVRRIFRVTGFISSAPGFAD